MSDTDFKAAAEASRRLLAKPSNDELLKLYALYKQGTQDPPFEKAPSPGMFDMKGSQVQRVEAVAEVELPQRAKVEYIALVEPSRPSTATMRRRSQKQLVLNRKRMQHTLRSPEGKGEA
ncbi:hypothetical protein MGYG_03036 [Nannizzia gypsea CBS 118893]|uniref:ACB domain-containing protein n=1 Tax=Arthroderma gypseum (strain ATCC MYA-4604 / CBS 118893) TaxID=535722 RepID=E4UQG0_ARTGP|nr:hypothetical protein MGYG_03036 [Nannizzia gypsea CBS 118893]EFR00030.1 hypothetical protein MGYG_03036 [Nannizzia gypsea CBS 118893]